MEYTSCLRPHVGCNALFGGIMLDVESKLTETDAAIKQLQAAGVAVPEEAVELREIMQRCVTAERLVATNMESQLSLGKEAYEAYARHTGFKSLATGSELPQWDGLSDAIRGAWTVSAAWVAGRVLRKFGVMS